MMVGNSAGKPGGGNIAFRISSVDSFERQLEDAQV
jgi:hypothetical protein